MFREVARLDNTEKKGRSGGTVGVGYISIMLIFTVICLTIFAVLSFQAVYSSDKMTNRSDGFTQQYYTADTEAKKTLSRLDGLAAEALDGFSFEEGFIEAVLHPDSPGEDRRGSPGGVLAGDKRAADPGGQRCVFQRAFRRAVQN